MSYKTSPIANRLSINKGFVNNFFPNNKAAYDQYLILWLSLYLFLKSYLAFKKIKLLTCEIRMVSNTHKLLYISFLKIPKRLKSKRKMWKKNLIKSRLNKLKNRGAISFIYQQWKKIKKWIFISKKKNKKKLKLYYKKIINSLSSFKKYKLLSGLKNKKIVQTFLLSRLNKPFLLSFNLNTINLKRTELEFRHIKNNLCIWKRIYPYFLNDMDFKKLLIHIWFLRKLNALDNKQKRIKKLKKGFIKSHLRFIKPKRFIYQSKKNTYKKEIIKRYFSLKQLYAKKSRYCGTKEKKRQNYLLYKKWKLLYIQNKSYLHYFYLYKKQNIKLFYLYFFYSLKEKQQIQFKFYKRHMYRFPQLIKRLLSANKKRTKNKRFRLYYLQGINIKIKKKIYLKKLKKNIKKFYLKKRLQRIKWKKKAINKKLLRKWKRGKRKVINRQSLYKGKKNIYINKNLFYGQKKEKKKIYFIKKNLLQKWKKKKKKNYFMYKNLLRQWKKKKKKSYFIHKNLLHTNNRWKIKTLTAYYKKLLIKVQSYPTKTYSRRLIKIKKKLSFLFLKKIKRLKKKLNKRLNKGILNKKSKKHINWLISNLKRKLIKRILNKILRVKKKKLLLKIRKKNTIYNKRIRKHSKKKLKIHRRRSLKKRYLKKIKNKLYIKKKIKNEYFRNKINQIELNLKFLMESLIFTFFHLSFNIKLINTLVLFKNKSNSLVRFVRSKKYTKKRNIMVSSLWLQNELQNIYTKKINILKIDSVWKKKNQENKHKEGEMIEEGRRKKIFGQIFPFLLAVHKYLDAQLLAEQISRFIKKKKKHYHIFYIIYDLLNALKLKQILSYQISITGKLNSKPRARKFYLVKGHIPNQSFTKRINFGLTQAKTPTGTFGIRVWFYF